MKHSRITTKYKEGSNDKLKTTCDALNVDKSTYTFNIHEVVEELRLALTNCLLFLELEKEHNTFITWFRNNTFSISSYFYLKGNTSTHNLPIETLKYMEQEILKFKSSVGNADDFLIFDDLFSSYLEQARISARKVERQARGIILSEVDTTAFPEPSRDVTLAIMNRLSSYLFWMTRYYIQKNNVEEKCWQGEVSEFPLTVQLD